MQPHFVDGIIGLAYRSIANSGAPTPMERLMMDNKDIDNAALCLNSKPLNALSEADGHRSPDAGDAFTRITNTFSGHPSSRKPTIL